MTDASTSTTVQNVSLQQVINLPDIYFNGFTLGYSNADVSLVPMCNGMPQAQLYMSFTTAKSLRDLLNDVLNEVETATGHEIMTSEYVGEKVMEYKKSKSAEG